MFSAHQAGLQEASSNGLGETLGLAGEQTSKVLEAGKDLLLAYGPGIVAGLFVLVLGRWATKLVVRIVRGILEKRQIEATLTGFFCNILRAVLTILVLITAAQTMGFETTSFVAVLGAATLAIGLALQGSLSNLASGVMLILFRPFKVGDFVEAGGTSGVVEEVGIFATHFRTGDNKKVVVPNASVTGGNITNYSAKETRRVDLVLGIGYDDDIEKAKGILERICSADERILAEPAVTIAVSALAESSVNIVCRPWVKTADYWPVHFDLIERIKREFDASGISIPYPQRDVHMYQAVS